MLNAEGIKTLRQVVNGSRRMRRRFDEIPRLTAAADAVVVTKTAPRRIRRAKYIGDGNDVAA